MAAFKWVRVSMNSPCPVCKSPDWCSISTDGAVAKCMRIEEGCFKSKEDRNGACYFLHRLTDNPPPGGPPPPPPGPSTKRADADTLHAVYSALLDCLALSDVHREALRLRRLTDEVIERNRYRTLPVQGRTRIARRLRERFGDSLLRVPGFVVKEGTNGRYVTIRGPAGLIVPCRDLAGNVVALKVRRDDPTEGGPRYVYLSSTGHGGPGPGSPAHVPLGTQATAELARVTEGELKADVVQALTALPTLSAPGVSNWRICLDVLKALGCKTVRLAFDADAPEKPAVARALSACAEALDSAGYAVELESWDAADGKGLDDLLTASKAPQLLQGDAVRQALREIVAAASALEEVAPPSELDRLQDVLDAGGAEALFRDRALLQALANLAVSDSAAFLALRASIRGRVSVRDLDRALQPFRRQSSTPSAGEGPVYFEQHGCIYRNLQTKDGPVPVPLCNFAARIVEDVVHDDGAEQTRHLAIEGTLADGSPLYRTEIPAADFPGMGWTVPAWGTRPVVYAGMGMKDHLRAALQLLSGEVPRRTIFGHIGWRKVGETWLYLHAGGAIGASGLVEEVPVLLPDPLANFRLPPPPPARLVAAGELWESARDRVLLLADAVRASLGFLRLGPHRLTFPLLAAVYRAVPGQTDFSLHLAGPTGSFKSEVAALAQQHYGPGMDARHLPASWSSTGNALEALAFVAKDALLVVDDFCPTGSAADVQRCHREADRLFRGQGNRAGRQRLRSDASLRPAKPPRGLTLSTGEDTPKGQSLRARLLTLDVSPGDFGPQPPHANPVLTACQRDAATGKYAAALSGFLRWLAPQYETVRGRLRAEAAELREQVRAAGQHARTPGIVADLALGLRYLLDFARAVGAISEKERTTLWQQGRQALAEAAGEQATHVAAAEPAALFLRLLSAAVASGRAHVADGKGNAPPDAQRWGWRPRQIGTGDNAETEWQPLGKQVGWLHERDLYLEPDAAFAEAQKLGQELGDGLTVTAQTLRRRLNEKGLLLSREERRQKLTVRRVLQGERREVLHVSPEALAASGGTDPGETEDDTDGEKESGQAPGDETLDEETVQSTPQIPEKNGNVGQLGRPDTTEEVSVGAVSDRPSLDGWGEWQ